ncbi:hypothetical protein [Lyngbya confervoides]|uniref:RiboL-PSP-HEPN domain-containing protein n=1 Tax=Lyngbya confervoides BDU141951 TaxID=1574623 RepID=A0ABD4TB37_9CYAN|nr:hypothetical protein [Lyngbya confervoides]MCM1985408.1 hypothetical protein [Lyngbya confervoides BDU141951]
MFSKDEMTPIDQLHKRFVDQLDTLIPFLGLAHEEIFLTLHENYCGWFSIEQQATLPNSFRKYRTQVSHGAFLLGYSYAEAFITDLIWTIYHCRRDLLPPDKALKFSEVFSLGDYERIIMKMIDNTLGDMNSLEKKIHHLETRLGLKVPQAKMLLEAHSARNALVHNSGRVNRPQTSTSRWQLGNIIELTVDNVHCL